MKQLPFHSTEDTKNSMRKPCEHTLESSAIHHRTQTHDPPSYSHPAGAISSIDPKRHVFRQWEDIWRKLTGLHSVLTEPGLKD